MGGRKGEREGGPLDGKGQDLVQAGRGEEGAGGEGAPV